MEVARFLCEAGADKDCSYLRGTNAEAIPTLRGDDGKLVQVIFRKITQTVSTCYIYIYTIIRLQTVILEIDSHQIQQLTVIVDQLLSLGNDWLALLLVMCLSWSCTMICQLCPNQTY